MSDYDQDNNIEQLLHNLNSTNVSIADYIIDDIDKYKENSLKLMSKHSAIAKKILNTIQDRDDSINLNTINSINVLKLLSDVYDNKIVVINQ
jgi:Protein of unknown function (DUF1098)